MPAVINAAPVGAGRPMEECSAFTWVVGRGREVTLAAARGERPNAGVVVDSPSTALLATASKA